MSSEPNGSGHERSTLRPFQAPAKAESEDSYEAAMRAADALFSPAHRQAPAEPALRQDEPPPASANGTVEAAPTKPAGRILRVIDEPPPPQLAALEAERAPKRRGRKPGSKNKPKPPIEAAVTAVAALATDRSPPAIAMKAAVAPPQASLANAIPVPKAAAPSGPQDRFTWVRDRLKPGDGWKRRRLPRICW